MATLANYYQTSTNNKDMELTEIFKRVKAASKILGLLTDEKRNKILNKVADAIIEKMPMLLAANAKDLAKMDKACLLYTSGKVQMNSTSEDATYNALLADLRQSMKLLAAHIEPKVYDYGFLKK